MEAWLETRQRALSFGGAAQLYDEVRPSYPEQLVDDLSNLLPGPLVLEVGAGTGKATALLAARGMAVSCLEPDPAMTAVLTRRCGGRAGVSVDIRSFEEWEGAHGAYDGVVSAQAWHWTNPAWRWDKAADAVTCGGVLGLFWNIPEGDNNDPVPNLIGAVYNDHGATDEHNPNDRDPQPDAWPADEMRAHPAFDNIRIRSYRWRQRFTSHEFVAYLNTTSHHRTLAPDLRESIAADIVDVIDQHGDGTMLIDWRTDLYLARRC